MYSIRIAPIMLVFAANFFTTVEAKSAPDASRKLDVSEKIVLANLDRYDAYLRVGKIRRVIKPKKASVLAPKDYPVTIEYWAGNTKVGWKTQIVVRAGLYGFNFKQGQWTLNELNKPGKGRAPVIAPQSTNIVRQPSSTVVRRTVSNRPSSRTIQRRIVAQPARRLPINADRNRWSPLARAVYTAGRIYQFVRDEQDRDLLRHLLIRAREDKDWDRLEDWIRDAKIPELYKHELRGAFEDLGRLSDADWKEIDSADEKDWDSARADLGDLLSDLEWENVTSDFAEIDTQDFWKDSVDLDLDDVDIADNVELGDLDTGDGVTDYNIDLGNAGDLFEDYDVGDFGIDDANYDLGNYDDFGGYDGAFDVDTNDFGGGYFGDDDYGDFGGFDDFDF